MVLGVSILFVGYLLMQIPSNIFLSKIDKPSLYLPTCMIVWGTMSALTAAVKDFGGLLAVRFFLGFVEAPYCKFVLLLHNPLHQIHLSYCGSASQC